MQYTLQYTVQYTLHYNDPLLLPFFQRAPAAAPPPDAAAKDKVHDVPI